LGLTRLLFASIVAGIRLFVANAKVLLALLLDERSAATPAS
jgi:hypothetical protein